MNGFAMAPKGYKVELGAVGQLLSDGKMGIIAVPGTSYYMPLATAAWPSDWNVELVCR